MRKSKENKKNCNKTSNIVWLTHWGAAKSSSCLLEEAHSVEKM